MSRGAPPAKYRRGRSVDNRRTPAGPVSGVWISPLVDDDGAMLLGASRVDHARASRAQLPDVAVGAAAREHSGSLGELPRAGIKSPTQAEARGSASSVSEARRARGGPRSICYTRACLDCSTRRGNGYLRAWRPGGLPGPRPRRLRRAMGTHSRSRARVSVIVHEEAQQLWPISHSAGPCAAAA